jgi:hypothetical protein
MASTKERIENGVSASAGTVVGVGTTATAATAGAAAGTAGASAITSGLAAAGALVGGGMVGGVVVVGAAGAIVGYLTFRGVKALIRVVHVAQVDGDADGDRA